MMSYYIFEVDFGIIYKFILSKFPVGSLAINQCAKKTCAWPIQLLVFIADCDHG